MVVATVVGSVIALLLLLHTLINALLLRRPASASLINEQIAILVPCRNEAENVAPLLASLQSQQLLAHVQIILLDDNSEDDTYARAIAAAGTKTTVIKGEQLPAGWLGKPFACHQLSQHAANADVLVFIDADVRLTSTAISQAIGTLRESGLSLISPYPEQLTGSWSERLLQPLLHWSWLATLPLRIAERSTRSSLTAANGQFLVVDGAAYRSIGGHRAIADRVLDDMDLLKALKAHGFRGVVIDGSELAQCRMYTNWSQVESGYTKWLWSAFGSPVITAASTLFLALTFIWPIASLSWIGLVGYGAAVLSRVLAAVRTKGSIAMAFLHPVSIALLIYLIARSWWRKYQGTTTWKGRVLAS